LAKSLRIIGVALLAILILSFLYLIRGILLPFLLAFLLAYLFGPIVDRLESVGMRRWMGVLAIYVVLAVAFGAIGIFLIPALAREISGFRENLVDGTAVRTVTIENRGRLSKLKIEDISLSDTLNFSIPRAEVPESLPPLGSFELPIEFRPSALGGVKGELTIVSNDMDERRIRISLIGNRELSPGQDIQVSVSDDMRLDFGNIRVGSTVYKSLKVMNYGKAPLRIESISLSDTLQFAVRSDPLPLVFPPASVDSIPSAEIHIAFRPRSFRQASATLSILSDDPDEREVTLRLIGNRGRAGAADIDLSTTYCDFGQVKLGYISYIRQKLLIVQGLLETHFPMLGEVDLGDRFSRKLRDLGSALIAKAPRLILSAFSWFSLLVIVPFVTFFLLKDGRRMKHWLISLVPNRYFELSLNLMWKINRQIGAYIRGQILAAIVVALLSIIGLRIIGLRYYVIVGLIAGISNLIPYLGPVIGILSGVLVALVTGGSIATLASVVVVFIAVQLIDNSFVSPLVIARSVHLHPLVVIFAILAGSQLMGLLGMLIAVPVTGTIKVAIETLRESLQGRYSEV